MKCAHGVCNVCICIFGVPMNGESTAKTILQLNDNDKFSDIIEFL